MGMRVNTCGRKKTSGTLHRAPRFNVSDMIYKRVYIHTQTYTHTHTHREREREAHRYKHRQTPHTDSSRLYAHIHTHNTHTHTQTHTHTTHTHTHTRAQTTHMFISSIYTRNTSYVIALLRHFLLPATVPVPGEHTSCSRQVMKVDRLDLESTRCIHGQGSTFTMVCF